MQLTDIDDELASDLHINDNGYVVWVGMVWSVTGPDSEILLYNGSTIKQLTNNDHSERACEINNMDMLPGLAVMDRTLRFFCTTAQSLHS